MDNGPATRSLTYDVHGNTLTDGMRTYTWDARNRLTGISRGGDTWTFAYNGANLRTSESKNGQVQRTWVWHGTEVVEERLAAGGKRRYWSYGVEEVNAAGAQTGKRFLMLDHLGSTRVVLDAAGATVASYDYDPWGVRRKLSGSGEEGVGYTGHWEHESGLVMAPYRVYDPGLGRWLSEDPIFEEGGVNLYGYVGNGPVGSWDPLGLKLNVHSDRLGKALERLRNTDPRLKKMIEDLEGSDHVHDVYEDPGGVSAPVCYSKAGNPQQRENEFNGVGVGTQTYVGTSPYDSEFEDGITFYPEDTLAHELQHAWDMDRGRIDRTPDSAGIPESEKRAVRTQNVAREAVGLPPRTQYGPNKVSDYGGKNCPIK